MSSYLFESKLQDVSLILYVLLTLIQYVKSYISNQMPKSKFYISPFFYLNRVIIRAKEMMATEETMLPAPFRVPWAMW